MYYQVYSCGIGKFIQYYCFINHFPLYAVRHPPVINSFCHCDPAFAGYFLINEFKEKGKFLKLSDKHGLQ